MRDDGRVERDRPVHEALHQVDPAARRVHLLVPQHVGRARRQAEAAVDAVGDQLRLHASTPSGSRAARTRSASGGQLVSTSRGTYAVSRRARKGGGGPSRPSNGTRPPASAWKASSSGQGSASSPPSSARAPASWASTPRARALEEERELARNVQIGGARRELRQPQLPQQPAPFLRVRRRHHERAGLGRERMEAQAHPRDQAEPPARAAEELPEVVARDVLDDLAARVRDRAVGEHHGHPEHEVAHGSEAVAARPREVGRDAGPDRRVAGRVEREPLAVLAEARVQRREADPRLDDAGEVARLVLEHGVEPGRRERRPDLDALGVPHEGRRLGDGAGLKGAQRGLPSRAGACGRGPGTSPQRRGVGNALPGFERPAGSNARRTRCITSRSSSPNISGIEHALSVPTPCSPVMRAAGVDARAQDLAATGLGPLGVAPRPPPS